MTKNNEMKIDLSKLTIEELEGIKFLNPVMVELEMNSRKSFKSPQEMVEEATQVLTTLRPFFENMKSCETKKTVYGAGLFEFLDKVINTGNQIEVIDEEKAEELGVDIEASQGTMADASSSDDKYAQSDPVIEPSFEQLSPAQVTDSIINKVPDNMGLASTAQAIKATPAAPATGGLDMSAIMAKAAALVAANK